MFALSECFVVFWGEGLFSPLVLRCSQSLENLFGKKTYQYTNVYYCFSTLQISLMSCYLILILVTPAAPPGGAFEYKMSSNFAPE